VSSSAGRAPGAGGPDARPESLTQSRLELFVGVDRETQCATGLGDCGEIDRTEFRGETARAAALCLMPPNRAVATVVENDDDDVRSLADRGLHLGHCHGEAAVTRQRHT